MCGRYTVYTEEEVIEMREIINEVNQRYLNTPEHAAMKTGEIFPTNMAPVLALGSGGQQARLMAWGFPKWQGAGVIINARAETAAQKPMFRSSLELRRCIVPSTGFFEWNHGGGKAKKDKYLVTLPGCGMLYMAGFWSSFTDGSGKVQDRFVILTAEANEFIAPLHDRMPVVLSEGDRRRWLEDFGWAMDRINRCDGTQYLLQRISA